MATNAAGARAVFESIDSNSLVSAIKVNNEFVITTNAPI